MDAEAVLLLDLAPPLQDMALASWPRGLYPLDGSGSCCSGVVTGNAGNAFEIVLPNDAAGTFQAYDGWLLVASASNERILGSVWIEHAWRPFAPSPVPQTFDPPLVVRFLFEE